MAKEQYDVSKHKKHKETIREKLRKMEETKENQRIYHELMETL